MERSPYVIWKNDWLGKRVDVDHFPKENPYQCIDLVKLYTHAVLGLRYARTGDAEQLRNNQFNFFNSAWKQIKGLNDLKQGDIIFSLNGDYGHVAIVDNIYLKPKGGIKTIQVLEQNGRGVPKYSGNGLGDNAIRLHEYKPEFFVGVWRHPLVDEMLSREYLYIEQKFKEQGFEDDNTTMYKYGLQYKQ